MKREVSKVTTPTRLDDLQAFCAVVDHGSITAAARHLGETKGSVSRRVSRLEGALDVKLLERQGRRARPTDEGLVYRRRIGEALHAIDDANAEMRALQREPRGHLRVTAVPGFVTGRIARAVAAFREAYPGITVEMLFTQALLSFERDDIDCAIRGVSGRLADSSLIAHALPLPRPCLVAAPDYLERSGRPQHPSDLERHTLLLAPIAGLTRRFSWRRGEETLEVGLRGDVLSHAGPFLQACARAGAGIALTSEDASAHDRATGRLVAVLPDWQLVAPAHLYLIHSGRPIAPKVKLFTRFVKLAFGETRSEASP